MKKEKVSLLYFITLLISFLFVSGNEKTTNNGVSIPFIEFNVAYIFLGLAIIALFLLIFYKGIKIDAIQMLLLIRLIFLLIPAFSNPKTNSSYFGNYILQTIPLITYTIMKCAVNRKPDVYRWLTIAAVIISLQVVLTFIVCGISYMAPYYKDYMVIPIAASNTIGCLLLPLLIIGNYYLKNPTKKGLFNFMIMLAIILTKSRTSMVFLCVIYLVYAIYFFINNKERTFSYKQLKFMTASLIFVIVAGSVVLIKFDVFGTIGKLMLGFAKKGSSIDSLFSGRFTLFFDYIEKFKDYPIFGNGLSYVDGGMRPHNFIAQILYEGGLVSMIIYIFIFVILFKKWYKNKNIMFYVTLLILCQSLIEPSIFLAPVDFILWSLIAVNYKKGGLKNV